MYRLFISLFFVFISIISFSQTWEEQAYKKNKDATFFDLVKSFNNYRDSIPYTRSNGYKPYARSIDFLESRIQKDGKFPSNSLWKEWEK